MGHTGKEKLFKDLSLTLVSYVCMATQIFMLLLHSPYTSPLIWGLMQSRQMQVQRGFVCSLNL